MNDTTQPQGKPLAIYDRINLIMKEVGGIEKDRNNASQGYKFRGIDDVYLKLQPLLAKYGVFTTLEVIDEQRTERLTKTGTALTYSILKIRYDFWATDGSKVSCTVIGEGMDSGDKASNKAMSVAQKYAFLQIFSIPTEDPKDPENDSHDVFPSGPTLGGPLTLAGEDMLAKANETPKAPAKPPVKRSPPPLPKDVAKGTCEHEWRKSKFPGKDGNPEEWCTKCKLKRPLL